MKAAFPIALAIAAIAAAALANDGVAEMTAGGLVLKQTDDIDMLSEDLYVSADRIRVRYRFRNRRPRDVRVTVAFPMPDRDFAEMRLGDVSFPSGFATRVAGRPVAMQVERRAFFQGVDETARLERLGLPIAVADDSRLADDQTVENHLIEAVAASAERLPPDQRRELVELGLLDAMDYDAGEGLRTRWHPMWTLRETWYWDQTFPAGRDLVVEHEYTPGVGSMAGSHLAYTLAQPDPDLDLYRERFCVDRSFLAAVERMIARATPDRPALLGELTVGYILTTGAGWRSPIGDFRLVVDKGAPENIVSFCGEGVRRISPTRFEMRRRNWRPDRDLAVLIVTPDRTAD